MRYVELSRRIRFEPSFMLVRYFSKRRMNVFIRIKDAISGIERINYAFIPYEEQPIDINKFSQVERTGAEKINDE